MFGATGFVGRLVAGHLAAARAGRRSASAWPAGPPTASRPSATGWGRPRRAGRCSWPTPATGPRWSRWRPRPGSSPRPSGPTRGTARRWWRPAPRPARTTPTSPARCCSSARSDRALPRPRASTGARIVHSCGFDSVPSDLGVLLAHEQAQADGAGPAGATPRSWSPTCAAGSAAARSTRCGCSSRRPGSDPALRRVLGRPLRAEPRPARPSRTSARSATPVGVSRDAGRGEWLGAVRHGVVQHPHRAAQQRAARTGPTGGGSATAR